MAATSCTAGPTSASCRRRTACATVSGQLRYAVPFFCDPDHDTLIECLPTCQSAERLPKYPPIKFGDYALWFAAQRYEHMAKVQTPDESQIARAPARPHAGRAELGARHSSGASYSERGPLARLMIMSGG